MKIALSFLAVGVLYASSTLAYIHTNISTEDSNRIKRETDIPIQLRQLIPVGESNLNLDGKTETGMPCGVNLNRSKLGFSANAFLLDSRGEMILKTFAKFQIGLGHNLQSLKSSEGDLAAVSAHFAEESYSSDTRSTLVVRREGEHIRSISIEEEKKGLFGWKSRIKTQCEF
jgi:hypothetical protein